MAETIFALATAAGPAAIAVVRLSGPASAAALAAFAGADVPFDRTARLRRLSDPVSGALLDEALVIGFPEGRSFTGEPSAELHLHGGAATSRSVLQALARMDGLRGAKPGEFTRRALENGRLDLTQAEGIADLVAAETEAQRRQALDAVGGAASRRIADWRGRLVRAMALLEAIIDFPDEGIDPEATRPIHEVIDGLRADIEAELGRSQAAQRIREGFTVAVLGAPNAGKSSLINVIARRDVVIASPHPGTTRDVVEVRCALEGHAVTFLDTAGLRETEDPVERLGVSRARCRAEEADLRILLAAPDCATPEIAVGAGDFGVMNKVDLIAGPAIGVSAKTGDGVDWLLREVGARAAASAAGAGFALRERHASALERAADHLAQCAGAEPEIGAELLGRAAAELDSIIGGVQVEDVLDEVFSAFCIGK